MRTTEVPPYSVLPAEKSGCATTPHRKSGEASFSHDFQTAAPNDVQLASASGGMLVTQTFATGLASSNYTDICSSRSKIVSYDTRLIRSCIPIELCDSFTQTTLC